MRYFVKLDKNDKPVCLYRFNSDEWKKDPEVPIVEQVHANGEWNETEAVSRFLIMGGLDLEELSEDDAKRRFPKAF